MKIKDKITFLFSLFAEDPIHFFGSALILGAVSLFSLGVFAIPAYVGCLKMFEAAISGKKIEFGIIFSSMNRVFEMFVLLLIMVLTAGFGAILIIPGLMIASLWLYAPMFMEFQGLGIEDSLKKSAKLAIEKNYMHHLMLTTALAALNSLGFYIVIGWIITVPLTAGILYLLFVEYTKTNELNAHQDSASLT